MAKVVEVIPPKELLVLHRDCGARIQYELRDVTEKYIKDYGGGGDTYYFATCPNCGREHSWVKF